MLTSYQTLLGGITAVLCAAGMVSLNDSKSFSFAINESSQIQPQEIAYRGSGRLDEAPENDSQTQTESSLISQTNLVSHRGSGRIRLQPTYIRL